MQKLYHARWRGDIETQEDAATRAEEEAKTQEEKRDTLHALQSYCLVVIAIVVAGSNRKVI